MHCAPLRVHLCSELKNISAFCATEGIRSTGRVKLQVGMRAAGPENVVQGNTNTCWSCEARRRAAEALLFVD